MASLPEQKETRKQKQSSVRHCMGKEKKSEEEEKEVVKNFVHLQEDNQLHRLQRQSCPRVLRRSRIV